LRGDGRVLYEFEAAEDEEKLLVKEEFPRDCWEEEEKPVVRWGEVAEVRHTLCQIEGQILEGAPT
jgi:hypothetical protein